MITIAIANQKGGVGKTTTAVTLGHGLALKNYNTLIVDLDPQGQCSSHLGLDQGDGVFHLLVNSPPLRDVIKTTGRPALWLLPGNKRTKTAETMMAIEHQGVNTLNGILEEQVNGDRLHFVVLDTAPSAGGLQENALFACDILVIPSAVDYLALEGVREILKTLKTLGRPFPPILRILPTFYDEVTKEGKANLSRLQAAFGEGVLAPIHRAVVLRECPAFGMTIFEHNGESRAGQEYGALVWGVLNATAG